jgi:uncharacterized membrane protein
MSWESLRPWQNLILLTIALVGPAIVVAAVQALRGRTRDLKPAGRLGVTLFLLTTSSAHFMRPEQMASMLPEWVPQRVALIHVTGLLEIALALGLWISAWTRVVGICIAAMLLLFLPANIYAACSSLPFGGHELGPAYLLVRVPYQLLVIAWVLWATGWERATWQAEAP